MVTFTLSSTCPCVPIGWRNVPRRAHAAARPRPALDAVARLRYPRRMRLRLVLSLTLACPLAAQTAPAPRPTLSAAVRQFVRIVTAIVALTHVRVIDGTGAPPRADPTVVIRDGRTESISPAAGARIPSGAQVLDLTGKSVIPGLVMVHEHLYYPTGPGTYANLTESFVRLYLAGGVTSMRTGGNMNGYAELNMKRAIDRGERAGPWIDATAPYLEGPGLPPVDR